MRFNSRAVIGRSGGDRISDSDSEDVGSIPTGVTNKADPEAIYDLLQGRFIVPKRSTGDLLQERSGKPDFISSSAFLLLPIGFANDCQRTHILKRSTKEICFRMPLPYCVYILFSHKDQLLYTGFTTNIEERVKNHSEGKTKSTAPRRPLELIFCEFYLFEPDARRREMYFKTTAGKKAVKLMLGGSLLKLGYKRAAGIIVMSDYEKPSRGPTEVLS